MAKRLGSPIITRGRSSSDEVSPTKAKEILKDGTIRGKPITKKQRGYFGARVGGK